MKRDPWTVALLVCGALSMAASATAHPTLAAALAVAGVVCGPRAIAEGSRR